MNDATVDNAIKEAAQQAGFHIMAALTRYAKEAVSEGRVRALIAEYVAAMPPRVIEVRSDNNVRIEEHTHPMFEKVLRLCAAGLNVLLTGPSGSGKTHIAAQVARALDRPFASLSLTSGASESQLLGRYLPTGEHGRFEYASVPFVDCYEKGGVFLLDEIDAADPNMMLVINSALSNGGFFNELRRDNPHVLRHDNSVMIGAANTFGTGADAMYVGRAQLDAATLDRWYIVRIDYDVRLDCAIAGVECARDDAWKPNTSINDSTLKDIGKFILTLREKTKAAKLRRVVSTRAMQKAVSAYRAGIHEIEVMQDLVAGWSKDELAKVDCLSLFKE